jgi:hypothetical protein
MPQLDILILNNQLVLIVVVLVFVYAIYTIEVFLDISPVPRTRMLSFSKQGFFVLFVSCFKGVVTVPLSLLSSLGINKLH